MPTRNVFAQPTWVDLPCLLDKISRNDPGGKLAQVVGIGRSCAADYKHEVHLFRKTERRFLSVPYVVADSVDDAKLRVFDKSQVDQLFHE